jgi:hypothetical protein
VAWIEDAPHRLRLGGGYFPGGNIELVGGFSFLYLL